MLCPSCVETDFLSFQRVKFFLAKS
jgi:hypothetical protein